MYSYRSSAEPQGRPNRPAIFPTSSSAEKKNVDDAPCQVVLIGPYRKKIPSVSSGKTKVQEEVLLTTRSDLNASLSLRAAPRAPHQCPGRIPQLALPLLDVGKSSILNALERAKLLGRRTRDHDSAVGTYEGNGALVQQTQSGQLRPSSVHTTFVAQDGLGTFRLLDLKDRGAEKEHGRSVCPFNEPATSLTRATWLVEEGGGQAVRGGRGEARVATGLRLQFSALSHQSNAQREHVKSLHVRRQLADLLVQRLQRDIDNCEAIGLSQSRKGTRPYDGWLSPAQDCAATTSQLSLAGSPAWAAKVQHIEPLAVRLVQVKCN
ncbi:hypothetical protein EDB87DRAFT_1582330 [Lactarius vividus]|nr:hypothetical protein EDB87DRAFT_1582330 [Lactarius vividus]